VKQLEACEELRAMVLSGDPGEEFAHAISRAINAGIEALEALNYF
jgi:hypothetical protein